MKTSSDEWAVLWLNIEKNTKLTFKKNQQENILVELLLFRYNSARIGQLGIRKPRELTLTIFMRLVLKIHTT